MQLLFVHGWSVTNTDTYGNLPRVLHQASADYGIDLDIKHIFLGKYISFHDEVTMDDIGRAMDRALRDLEGNDDNTISPFSCITHSTGGPVVRYWLNKYYGPENLKNTPLKHLIMLAPANHGSALAKLGKAKIGRIKAWFSGVEPGQRVLDWLSLGSEGQWTLNELYTGYNYQNSGFFPFVLTGQGINKKLYDFLNSYLIEKGSDGVVRITGANMNYRYYSLIQTLEQIEDRSEISYRLVANGTPKISENIATGIYNIYSHSGTKMGIMASIRKRKKDDQFISDIFKCLQVNDHNAYQVRVTELNQMNAENQARTSRYCMIVFSIKDDTGVQIGKDDYDLFILAGDEYDADKLPKGFLLDRQMNDKTGRLIYYLDANRMNQIKDGKFGFRVVARPSIGFSYYCEAEYRSDGISAMDIFMPNQTTYIEVILHRFVDKNVFRFGPVTGKPEDFKKTKPSGEPLASKFD